MIQIILAASFAFVSTMSEKEIQQTGINKLTAQEKMTLQEWVDQHYTKKHLSNKKKSDPLIYEVLHLGSLIRLSDDTLWEIHKENTLITQSWITPVGIKVTHNDDPKYPYTLTNTLTGSSVKALKK
jgi:hypothetical protein